MKIEKHRLTGSDTIQYKKTPNTSGKFPADLPDTIVIHYTAAPSLSSAVNWLTSKKSLASAHLIIGREGDIVQLADFDTITWHAGVSKWGKREKLNNYSIGIEIDNCGILSSKDSKTYIYSEKGPQFSKDDVIIAKHKNGGKAVAWQKYPEAQIDLVFAVCELLCKTYNIKYILGHEEITNRKTDPGPAFPLEELRKKLLSKENVKVISNIPDKGIIINNTPLYKSTEAISEQLLKKIPHGVEVKILEEKKNFYKVSVFANGYVSKQHTAFDNSDSDEDGFVVTDGLNFREKPDPKSETLGIPLGKGTKFKLLENSNLWIFIRVERIGFIPKDAIR
jgi:N-acetylmuramoyl-L-alanine amidase